MERWGPASGIQVHAQPVQRTYDGFQPILVKHGQEGALDSFLPVHCGLQAIDTCFQGASLRPIGCDPRGYGTVLRKGYQHSSGGGDVPYALLSCGSDRGMTTVRIAGWLSPLRTHGAKVGR